MLTQVQHFKLHRSSQVNAVDVRSFLRTLYRVSSSKFQRFNPVTFQLNRGRLFESSLNFIQNGFIFHQSERDIVVDFLDISSENI